MKCDKPRWGDPTQECEFDHPCPFHDLVINFEDNPPSIALPMDNVELIKAHLPLIIEVALNEGAKYSMKKIIMTDIKIEGNNISGDTIVYPHKPAPWVNVALFEKE